MEEKQLICKCEEHLDSPVGSSGTNCVCSKDGLKKSRKTKYDYIKLKPI